MSSYRKDARWTVAIRAVQAAGLNWNDLAPSAHALMLDAAETLLDYLSSDQVEELAGELE